MAIFDSKNFNGNVFKQYVDRVPNLNRNELIKSRAIKKRQDIADSMSDQVGGNYVTIPLARHHQRARFPRTMTVLPTSPATPPRLSPTPALSWAARRHGLSATSPTTSPAARYSRLRRISDR